MKSNTNQQTYNKFTFNIKLNIKYNKFLLIRERDDMTDNKLDNLTKLIMADAAKNEDIMNRIHKELVAHIVGMITKVVGELDEELRNEMLPNLLIVFDHNMEALHNMVMTDVFEEVHPNWRDEMSDVLGNVTNETVH